MLSITSEHALRAMACLAYSDDAEMVLAHHLSSEADVPLQYLSKILGSLTKVGILQATRGRNGGYRLARAADRITLLNVVELFDGVKAKPDCLFGGGRKCSDDNPCSGHESFKKVRQWYIEFLESTTIADIAGPPYQDGAPSARLPDSEFIRGR